MPAGFGESGFFSGVAATGVAVGVVDFGCLADGACGLRRAHEVGEEVVIAVGHDLERLLLKPFFLSISSTVFSTPAGRRCRA